MSHDDYEQYAEFERRQANIAAGRRPDAKPEHTGALPKSHYGQQQEQERNANSRDVWRKQQEAIESPEFMPEPEHKLKPTIYKDQNGREFQFIDGQRVYLD